MKKYRYKQQEKYRYKQQEKCRYKQHAKVQVQITGKNTNNR
jgi:hypothetical protein